MLVWHWQSLAAFEKTNYGVTNYSIIYYILTSALKYNVWTSDFLTIPQFTDIVKKSCIQIPNPKLLSQRFFFFLAVQNKKVCFLIR